MVGDNVALGLALGVANGEVDGVRVVLATVSVDAAKVIEGTRESKSAGI
jgi:hypothetical protein